MQTLDFEQRPWGCYDVLSESSYCKVKEITIDPGQRLSLQSHEKRQEQWTAVRGRIEVIIDDEAFVLMPGDTIKIPQGAKHRAWNVTEEPVSFIEVQTGEYFGEDDITRYEDDYGR